MGQASDSITVTPGLGATIATFAAGGKEYQGVVPVDEFGYAIGDGPTYDAFSGSIAAAANKVYMHLFNATGSGKVLKVKRAYIQPVVVANALTTQTWSVRRTSAVGTTGNTAITVQKRDSASANLPAGVTAAHSATAGATDAATWFDVYIDPEETRAGVYLQPWYNILATDAQDVQDYILREGEGMKIVNVTGGTLNYSVLLSFNAL